ncbi:hypothetical protein OE88DRAFT_1655207, partial [Heliocybe sulcata]
MTAELALINAALFMHPLADTDSAMDAERWTLDLNAWDCVLWYIAKGTLHILLCSQAQCTQVVILLEGDARMFHC